ncbi:MAG: hypothetical protein Q9221_006800 [Calogaya cf. arnoldii]
MRALVLPLIAPTASGPPDDGTPNTLCSQITSQRARHLFVLLSGCAAKNNQGQEWTQSLVNIIDMSHRTADLVVRALIEDWGPVDRNNPIGVVPSTETTGSYGDESGLPGWKGISAGLERLNGLLLTIQAHSKSATAAAVIIPIGKTVNLIDRILSALPPSQDASKDTAKGTRTNPEIGRDERETLWTGLPQLHVSAMQILEHLILRLGDGPMALSYRFLVYILWIFEHEYAEVQIRKTVYKVVALLLPHCRSGVPRMVASGLDRCIRTGCDDLLPVRQALNPSDHDVGGSKTDVSKGSTSADAYSENPGSSIASSIGTSEVQRLAEHMLSTVLAHVPPSSLRLPLRTKIYQTAILAQSNSLLRSSILNAPNYHEQQQNSLMPLLARQFPRDHGTEALVRPRMPPVQRTTDDQSMDLPQEDEDREMIYQEDTRPSGTIPHRPQDNGLPTHIPSDQQEQPALSSEVHLIEGPLGEAQSPAKFPSEPERQTVSLIPAKRSLEMDLGSMHGNASGEFQEVLAPSTEPASKRLREENGIYIPPVREDDLPPLVAVDLQEENIPRSTDPSTSFEPLESLPTTKPEIDDDSSDDSSLPPMDLTLATDDED